MRCNLYANDELVGWAELTHTDPPMGCASGPFYPNDSYRRIQPIIREYNLYDGTLGEVNEQKRLEEQTKIDALRLSVVTVDRAALDPLGGVDVVDFSDGLVEEPSQLDVIGLPFDIYRRLSHLAYPLYH